MAGWEGRSEATSWGYRFFIGLIRWGGLKPAYAFLPLVTYYYYLFKPSATRPLFELYHRRLGYSPARARRMIRRNLYQFGMALIDRIALVCGAGKEIRHINLEGTRNIMDMLDQGRGGILVGAHLGNGELAGHLLKEYTGGPVNILMFDGEEAGVKAALEEYEQGRGFRVIYVRDDLSHIYEILAALGRNELVCMHADRFRPGHRTLKRSFLGEMACFPAGPFILASKLKAPVCFVFGFKEARFRYRYYSWPAKIYEGRGEEGMQAMLDDYLELVEQMIRKYPEQWFNYYDFWKQGMD